MSSCRNNCPVASGRAYKLPRHRLDAVRRKLDFSDEVSESPPGPAAPADKYGHFKKISESYSAQEIEPPMYTSAQMADVPDSFLEWAAQKEVAPAPPAKKVTSVQTKETTEVEMPESFLEFCQERIEKQRYAPRAPSPAAAASRAAPNFFPPQPTTPYNTSYYGYDMPGAPRGMLFDPRVTSTPRTPALKSPSPYGGGGYYPFPQMGYYSGRAPSFCMEGCTPAPSRSPPAGPPVGLGRYAYPASRSPQTPPTPSWLYGGARPTNYTPDSTISSGDILDSCSPECPASRQARSAAVEDYDMDRRDLSDTVCTDDLLNGNSNPSHRCPVLGVTPVHSSVSFSSSAGNIDERQKISKSIENELMAREAQERQQLETDLSRWQQARRKLVMNTANMGA